MTRNKKYFGFIQPQSAKSLQFSLWTIKHIEKFDLGPDSKNSITTPHVPSLWKHIVHDPKLHSSKE